MTDPDHRRPRRLPEADVALADDVTDDGAIQLNATAYAVWQLCDGQTTVDEIEQAAAELFAAPADQIRADVTRLLDDLRAAGAITWDAVGLSPS